MIGNTLNVAISTVAPKRDSVIEYIRGLPSKYFKNVTFSVISQMEACNGIEEIQGRCLLIKSIGKGLSKSRNIAIRNCSASWIWFQDDDVSLVHNNLPGLVEFLEKTRSDLVLGKVLSLENERFYFKDYSRYSVPSSILSLRISSIEMIASMEFLRSSKVFFDENLGLGSSLPSCEENLFFYKIVCRKGARYEIFDYPICRHTTTIEARGIDYKGRYKARGYLLLNLNPILFIALLVRWTLRKGRDGVPRISRLLLMLNGAKVALKKRFKG